MPKIYHVQSDVTVCVAKVQFFLLKVIIQTYANRIYVLDTTLVFCVMFDGTKLVFPRKKIFYS